MNIKTLFFSLALLLPFYPLQSPAAELPTATNNTSQSVTLDMQNMTCAMCKITIRKALQGVAGVQQVQVDFDSKTASVTFDPQKTSIDALIEATTNVGYPASVHPTK